MKKFYSEPMVRISTFASKDIITTSGETSGGTDTPGTTSTPAGIDLANGNFTVGDKGAGGGMAF